MNWRWLNKDGWGVIDDDWEWSEIVEDEWRCLMIIGDNEMI